MRIRSLFLFFGSVLAAWLGLAIPALAAPAGHSTTYAGYTKNGGGGLYKAAMTTSFKVPKVNCGSADSGIAPGIEIPSPKTQSSVDLFVGCINGKSKFFPVIVLNGNETNYQSADVRPGDRLVLHLSEGPKHASITFQDPKRNITKRQSGGGAKGLGFPGIGDEAWYIKGKELPVPNFGTIHFAKCFWNGKPWGAGGSPKAPSVLRYNRYSGGGKLQIATGPLNSKRNAFSTVLKHS